MMQIISKVINKFVRNFLVMGINLYQKYLSPYKGYCCAHRMLHNGESCSQYVKRSFLEQDLSKAINLTKERFVECGEAAEILTAQKRQKNQQQNHSLVTANVQRRSGNLLNRRAFLYLVIPAFFTFGLATPALANKGKAFSQCMKISTKAAVKQDQKDGKCGNEPELYYGLCCLGIIGGIFANENQ